MEKRYLISVLMKLSSLSEKYDPGAEVRWLSFAIRELIQLLPLCQGLHDEVYGFIVNAERLLALSSSFSDVPPRLNGNLSTLSGSREPGATGDGTKHDLTISENELASEDEFLSPPLWYLPDIPSAFALVLRCIADLAENHNDFVYVH